MRRVPVRSTTLRSTGYEPATKTLEVEFRTGLVYAYENVPAELWQSFQATRSKGKFFNLLIRDRFRYHQVRTATPPPARPANA